MVRGVSHLVMQVVGVPFKPERSNDTHSMRLVVSFSGLTYLTLFLCAQFKLFIPLGRRRTHALLFFVALAPMVVAGFISATRVSDFRHRGSDVLAGAILGATSALIAYRHWHPWVTDRAGLVPWDVLHMEENEKRVPHQVLPTVHPDYFPNPYEVRA